jgi:hypothetical protein
VHEDEVAASGPDELAEDGAVQVLSAAIAPVLDRVTCPVRSSSAQVATSAEARMIRRQKASV